MCRFKQFVVAACAVAGVAVATPVVAAPISFVSKAGMHWTSVNSVVCGGAAACAGSTKAIEPHGVWQPNAPEGSGAVWVSYRDTGITGELAPIGQPLDGLLMSIRLNLNSVAGTRISFKIWADDTARISFNGDVVREPNLTQNACAAGSIGCEPNEFGKFSWTATGNDVIRIDTYQVGTDTNAAANPFGVLFYGSFNHDPSRSADVPEPASLALLGLGMIGAGLARGRRKKN